MKVLLSSLEPFQTSLRGASAANTVLSPPVALQPSKEILFKIIANADLSEFVVP